MLHKSNNAGILSEPISNGREISIRISVQRFRQKLPNGRSLSRDSLTAIGSLEPGRSHRTSAHFRYVSRDQDRSSSGRSEASPVTLLIAGLPVISSGRPSRWEISRTPTNCTSPDADRLARSRYAARPPCLPANYPLRRSDWPDRWRRSRCAHLPHSGILSGAMAGPYRLSFRSRYREKSRDRRGWRVNWLRAFGRRADRAFVRNR